MKIFFVIFLSIFFLLAARDTYLVWFKPNIFIQEKNRQAEEFLNRFPFMQSFKSNPAEDFVIRINRLLYPFVLMFLLFILIIFIKNFSAI